MWNIASLILVLSAFWILNSGHYTPLMLTLAACSVACVILVSRQMGLMDRGQDGSVSAARLPAYWAWLVKEVVVANLEVIRCIWVGRQAISPRQLRLKVGQKSDLGKVIYANSITLTPGTVSMDLEGDTILIHALTRQAMDHLQTGAMDRRVQRLETRCSQ